MPEIEHIKEIKEGRPEVLHHIYKQYRNEFVRWALNNYNTEPEEAKDVFQDVVLSFYDNINSGKLTRLTCDLKTYLFQIGKFKLINLGRRRNVQVTFHASQVIKEQFDTNAFMKKNHDFETSSQLHYLLSKLCNNCQRVLNLFYIQELPLKEVARIMNYKNAEVAKKKRYQCFKRLCEIGLIAKSNGKVEI